MKKHTGLFSIFLVSCGALPLPMEQTAEALLAARDAEARALPAPPCTSTFLRVGIEYLPPKAPECTALQRVAPDPAGEPETPPQEPVNVPPPRPIPAFDADQQRWDLHKNDIKATQNTVDRMTKRFLAELMGDDRKRVQRSIGRPLLGAELRLSTDPMSNFLDERDREDQQRLLTENGTRMISRPLREALKELPIVNDVEHVIQDFKESNRKYTESSEGFGRLSLRIRGSDIEDPIELRWKRGGFRLSATLTYVKASYGANLGKDLKFSLRSKYDLEDYDWRLSGNLEYDVNSYTTFNILAGNEINILGGQFAYPGGPQSDETSTGVLLYFHHQF